MRTICALFVAAAMLPLVGCGEARMMQSQTVLLDGTTPPPQMFHVQIVPDPLAGAGVAATPVLKGGPAGANNTTTANKASLLKPAGFFRVGQRESQVRLFVAVRGPRELRIEVLSKAPAGKQVHRVTLAGEGEWQEVVLPVDLAKLPAGATVNDITVFQLGQDPSAELYIRAITLRGY